MFMESCGLWEVALRGEALLLLLYGVRRHGSNGILTREESYPAQIPGVNENHERQPRGERVRCIGEAEMDEDRPT